jgi:hypothetical protein
MIDQQIHSMETSLAETYNPEVMIELCKMYGRLGRKLDPSKFKLLTYEEVRAMPDNIFPEGEWRLDRGVVFQASSGGSHRRITTMNNHHHGSWRACMIYVHDLLEKYGYEVWRSPRGHAWVMKRISPVQQDDLIAAERKNNIELKTSEMKYIDSSRWLHIEGQEQRAHVMRWLGMKAKKKAK